MLADRLELITQDQPGSLWKIRYADEPHQKRAGEIVRKLISIALNHHLSTFTSRWTASYETSPRVLTDQMVLRHRAAADVLSPPE